MAELTRKDMQLLDEHDRTRDDLMKERLDKMGVALRVAHYTGDSSYPTEYTLIYGTIRAVGPTFDLAVADFIEELLKRFGGQALP